MPALLRYPLSQWYSMQYEFGTDRRTGEEAETAGYASSVPRYLVALCMSILGTCYNNEMTASSDSGQANLPPPRTEGLGVMAVGLIGLAVILTPVIFYCFVYRWWSNGKLEDS